MARGTGTKRGPRQPSQRQSNPAAIRHQAQQQQQAPPNMLVQPSPQQYPQHQTIMATGLQPQQQLQQQPKQWYTNVNPQMQMQPRMQQQQTPMQHTIQQGPMGRQQGPMRQVHPQSINPNQQPQQHQTQFIPQHRSPQLHLPPQQVQLIQQQQQQQAMPVQIPPQIQLMGNSKRRAQEPPEFVLTNQLLREPLISSLERNVNKNLFSHTLHRTFGVARMF